MPRYQPSSFPCMNPPCRKAGVMVPFGLAMEGPFAVEKDRVTCASCGANYQLDIITDSPHLAAIGASFSVRHRWVSGGQGTVSHVPGSMPNPKPPTGSTGD